MITISPHIEDDLDDLKAMVMATLKDLDLPTAEKIIGHDRAYICRLRSGKQKCSDRKWLEIAKKIGITK